VWRRKLDEQMILKQSQNAEEIPTNTLDKKKLLFCKHRLRPSNYILI
jgi:hypothetical protein